MRQQFRSDAKQCFRCKSLLHRVADCPFPPTEKVGKDSTTGAPQAPKRFGNVSHGRGGQQRTTPERFLHEGREICNNWQYDRCKYPNCNRAHVCKGCRGVTPHHRCATCSPGNVRLLTLMSYARDSPHIRIVILSLQ